MNEQNNMNEVERCNVALEVLRHLDNNICIAQNINSIESVDTDNLRKLAITTLENALK